VRCFARSPLRFDNERALLTMTTARMYVLYLYVIDRGAGSPRASRSRAAARPRRTTSTR
jgi:hypothetical protein